MILLFRLIALVTLVALVPFAAVADEGVYPIRADDGSIIANHRVPAELESCRESSSWATRAAP
jgi:hypothetical protein